MHPNMNDKTWVIADTCGKMAISTVTSRNVMTADLFHHPSLIEGVLRPMMANMMFENPTGSTDEKNQDKEAIRNAHTRSDAL